MLRKSGFSGPNPAAGILGSLVLRFGSERVSAILLLVWFGIFVTVYRLRYKRL
jgi:hypothetical protein